MLDNLNEYEHCIVVDDGLEMVNIFVIDGLGGLEQKYFDWQNEKQHMVLHIKTRYTDSVLVDTSTFSMGDIQYSLSVCVSG